MRPPPGVISWTELVTRDVEAAKRFYGTTLGWTFEDMSSADGIYFMARDGDQPVCGIVPIGDAPEAAEAQSHWICYVEVDDVDRRAAQVVGAGGQLIQPPTEMPGVGRIAIIEDATGAFVGWITSVDQPDM